MTYAQDKNDEMNLYLEKLAVFCHWYVNSYSDWESRDTYRKLCAELDAMDREEFREATATFRERAEELIGEVEGAFLEDKGMALV